MWTALIVDRRSTTEAKGQPDQSKWSWFSTEYFVATTNPVQTTKKDEIMKLALNSTTTLQSSKLKFFFSKVTILMKVDSWKSLSTHPQTYTPTIRLYLKVKKFWWPSSHQLKPWNSHSSPLVTTATTLNQSWLPGHVGTWAVGAMNHSCVKNAPHMLYLLGFLDLILTYASFIVCI